MKQKTDGHFIGLLTALSAYERAENEAEAREAIQKILVKETNALCRAVYDEASIAPPAYLADRCRQYTEFNVKPSKTEVEVLIRNSYGLPCYHLINGALETVGSNYRLLFYGLQDLEGDLRYLDKMKGRKLTADDRKAIKTMRDNWTSQALPVIAEIRKERN